MRKKTDRRRRLRGEESAPTRELVLSAAEELPERTVPPDREQYPRPARGPCDSGPYWPGALPEAARRRGRMAMRGSKMSPAVVVVVVSAVLVCVGAACPPVASAQIVGTVRAVEKYRVEQITEKDVLLGNETASEHLDWTPRLVWALDLGRAPVLNQDNAVMRLERKKPVWLHGLGLMGRAPIRRRTKPYAQHELFERSPHRRVVKAHCPREIADQISSRRKVRPPVLRQLFQRSPSRRMAKPLIERELYERVCKEIARDSLEVPDVR